MIFVIPLPLVALAVGTLGGLEYLRRLVQPEASPTSPVSSPSNPPFTGGQCIIFYAAEVRFYYFFTNQQGQQQETFDGYIIQNLAGKIIGVESQVQGNTITWGVRHDNGNTFRGVVQGDFLRGAIISVTPQDPNQLDNCGDPTDPNTPPAPSVGDDGLADSPSPDIDVDGLEVVTGSPIVAIPSFAALLAAALAAAKNAATALEAIKAIADALEALKDLFDRLKDFLDKKKEEDSEENETIIRYDFGSISRDGFLRLYPDASLNELEPVYLDLQVVSIPLGFGRYFGNFSPNYFRYKELGYISFVSNTFGVMETYPIEFGRVSLPIPVNAIGFFYHLGLNGIIKANASGFYLKKEKAV